MSRIDEALRRASGQSSSPSEPAPSSGPAAPRLMEDASFDPFPAEVSLLPTTRESNVSQDVGRSIPLLSKSGEAVASASAPIVVVRNDQPLHPQSASPEALIAMPSLDLRAQYRRIGAILLDAQSSRSLKTVAVTSALPEDDRARSAVHLAMTLVETYARRVLLIDADRDNPAVHRLLGLPNDAGFGEAMLTHQSSIALLRVTPLLWVLPAGREAGQQLAPERIEALLAEMSLHFDWIILSAPPASVVRDTQLLVRLSRAALIVISARSTPFPAVHRAISDLGQEHIIGTVLNGSDASSGHGAV